MFFGSVDASNAVYQTLLLLREVVEHVMAPTISRGQVAYMDIIITDYLQRRMALFPDDRLRPKHHYMSHYASFTLKFGPLIRLWTMRFESKHQYFKKCIRNSQNFVNVTGMLAFRHQMLQAYLSASRRFCVDAVDVHSVMSVNFSHISHEILDCIVSAELTDAHLCREVVVKATLYSKGSVLPMHLGLGNKVTEFRQIQIIAISSCVNVVVSVHAEQFDFDIGSYIIENDSDVIQCVALVL